MFLSQHLLSLYNILFRIYANESPTSEDRQSVERTLLSSSALMTVQTALRITFEAIVPSTIKRSFK